MNKITCGGMAKLAALLFAVALFVSGCATTPSAGGGSSNYKEVFPGTGMPEFPDGSA